MNRFDKREHAKMRIGKTAAKVFNEKGFLETTIADIASAARISKGGIFHYFPTKSEILYHILSEYMDVVLEGLDKDLKNIEVGSSRIQFIISHHIDLYNKNTAEAKLLLHEAHNLPLKKFKIIAEKEKKYFQIVVNILSDFLNSSTSKEKLTGITFTLFGMLNWIYSWYSPRGPLTPKELSEIIYNIFTKGVVSYQRLRK
jgi:AcrR family transcriptional regulator